MKINQIAYLAVVAAVSLSAVAMPIADPTADNEVEMCRPGMPCERSKPSDVPEVSESQSVSELELRDGVKPSLELDMETEDDEESQNTKRFCRRPGMSCFKKRSDDREEHEMKPEAEADIIDAGDINVGWDNDSDIDIPNVVKRWCRRPGMSCFKKRSDDREGHEVKPEAGDVDVDWDNDSEIDTEHVAKRWCRRPVMGCFRGRSVDHEEHEVKPEADDVDANRNVDWDNDSEIDTEHVAKRWCRRPGMGCYKAKRFLNEMAI